MRIPDRILEHRVDIRPVLAVRQPDGDRHGTSIADVHALVVAKEAQVVDARIGSETRGALVASSAHILLQPEDYAAPGSLITIWKGTPLERTAEVVAAAYLEHTKAPSQAQAWLV